MQRKFCMCFHVLGDMGANAVITFTVPSDCQLVHVSACQSDSDAAAFTIGDSGDADEYLTTSAVGASGTPNEFDGDDFVDADGNSHTKYYPHIAAGTVMIITVDYDYNAGQGSGNAADLTLVLTFLEG